MNISVHRQYARTLYGIETHLDGNPVSQISALWDRFLREELAADIPSRLDESLIGLYCDFAGDPMVPGTYFLGCEVLDVCSAEEGFAIRFTPAADYAEFQAHGAMPQAAIQMWQQIQELDLQRNYDADFEIHDPISNNEVLLHVGICLGDLEP